MPAVSKKQKRLMDAAAHNPAFAKKVGIPQSVAMDFSKASKGRKFREGGEMKNCYKDGGLAKKGEGIAKKGFAKGGMVAGMGQSQGKTLNQNVKKLEGDKVAVRGVGAARARTAMIY
mgnify:CR=1 FL=1|jgi:hypothetical protein